MIEPHELKSKQFSKVVRGYSQTEVDEHIDFVIAEYTKLYRENDELSRKLAEAEAQVEAYKKDEESIRSALINAQRASSKIINDANDRADELLRASKTGCEKILAEFRVEVGLERQKLTSLKKVISAYKARIYREYSEHIAYLEKISPDYDLGELDLSEEEAAASDENYVRKVLQNVKEELATAAAQREAEKERLLEENRESGGSGAVEITEEIQYTETYESSEPVYFIDESAEEGLAEDPAELYSDASPEDELIDSDDLKGSGSDDVEEAHTNGVILELNRRFSGINSESDDNTDRDKDGGNVNVPEN
ncbi:MAG: DivIVA domain-containing protein [Clostridiales bacterium]|nr:DivIVA domain-containing protein [Clostridiales bacterium]